MSVIWPVDPYTVFSTQRTLSSPYSIYTTFTCQLHTCAPSPPPPPPVSENVFFSILCKNLASLLGGESIYQDYARLNNGRAG
jgi:hypothetical protein